MKRLAAALDPVAAVLGDGHAAVLDEARMEKVVGHQDTSMLD